MLLLSCRVGCGFEDTQSPNFSYLYFPSEWIRQGFHALDIFKFTDKLPTQSEQRVIVKSYTRYNNVPYPDRLIFLIQIFCKCKYIFVRLPPVSALCLSSSMCFISSITKSVTSSKLSNFSGFSASNIIPDVSRQVFTPCFFAAEKLLDKFRLHHRLAAAYRNSAPQLPNSSLYLCTRQHILGILAVFSPFSTYRIVRQYLHRIMQPLKKSQTYPRSVNRTERSKME